MAVKGGRLQNYIKCWCNDYNIGSIHRGTGEATGSQIYKGKRK